MSLETVVESLSTRKAIPFAMLPISFSPRSGTSVVNSPSVILSTALFIRLTGFLMFRLKSSSMTMLTARSMII